MQGSAKHVGQQHTHRAYDCSLNSRSQRCVFDSLKVYALVFLQFVLVLPTIPAPPEPHTNKCLQLGKIDGEQQRGLQNCLILGEEDI